MTYLWLTRYAPYAPLTGGQIDYSRDVVQSLSAQGRVIGLVYATPGGAMPPAGGAIAWEALPIAAKPKIASLLSPLPNVASRNVDTAYLDRAVALAGEADAVFVDFIAMAWIAEPLVARLKALPSSPPVIVVTHNHEGAVRQQMAAGTKSLPMRLALQFDGWKAARLERRANDAANGLTAITSTDAAAFAQECATPSIVLPPAYDGPSAPDRRITAAIPRTMTILGNRTSHHKVMVLGRTLAALTAAGLDAQAAIDVAGAGEIDGFRQKYPRFHYRGFVPDLVEYLAGIRLGLLTDDIGGGFKIRAMSYAMLGVPMLALREAMTGMEFEEGRHYVAADTLPQLARIAATLIDDLDRLESLRREAYQFAVERFDKAAPGRRLAAFVDRLRGAPPASIPATAPAPALTA